MGHSIPVDLRKGGGVAANFITGSIEVEPTAMHTSGTALVLPDLHKVAITNGTATLDLEPSPAGENPAWGYKVTIRSNSGRAWAEYVSVPAGAGPTAYTALPRLTASPAAPPLTTWHQIVEEVNEAKVAAQESEANAAAAAALVGAPADVAVKTLIEGSTQTKDALNAKFADAKDAAVLGNLNMTGLFDRVASNARSQVDFAGKTSVSTAFADLAGATQDGDFTVTDGKLHRSTSATTAAYAGWGVNIPAGEPFVLRARFEVPDSTSSPELFMVGVSSAAGGSAPGYNSLHATGFTRGKFTASLRAGAVTSTSGAAWAPGTYYVTMYGNATTITAVTHNTDESVRIVWTTPRTAVTTDGSIPSVAVYSEDTRGAAGTVLTGLSLRTGYVSPKEPAAAKLAPAVTSIRAVVGGQNILVRLPEGYRSDRPTPFIFSQHGYGGTEETMLGTADPAHIRTTKAFNAAGFAVASSNQHGANWGNQASLDDLVELYRYCRDNFNLGPIVMIANSMGNLSSLNAIASRALPGVVGYYGCNAVISLATAYQNSGFTASIRTAYGIAADGSDYAAKTAGYDPMLRDPRAFRGIRMRFAASAGDTLIYKTQNTDPFRAKIEGFVAESGLFVGSGNHDSQATITPEDMVPFAQRCIAG